MTSTVGHAPKLSSGIDVVDETWGGLYKGGSYLVSGRTASNRGFIPILFAACAGPSGRCLYLASEEPQAVIMRAERMGMDLLERGAVDLRQTPASSDRPEVGDDRIASELTNLVSLVEGARPERVVIDDFMPFVRFHSFGRFRAVFIDMLERVDAVDATLMVVMAEPANDESRAVIDFMRRQMTGALHIERSTDNGSSDARRVRFIPNIGHVGLDAVKEWDVRTWLRPGRSADADVRSSRRYRFAERGEDSPSPRAAEWSDAGTSRPEGPVRTIRLGQKSETSSQAVERLRESPSSDAFETRVPSIPLGRARPSGTREPAAERRESPIETYEPSTETSEPPATQEMDSTQEPAIAAREPRTSATGPPEPVVESGEAVPRPTFQPVADTRHYGASHTDREAFRARLQQQFLRNEVNETPFVLVALRMDRPDEKDDRPFDFEFILDLVTESLRDQDDVLVDLESERLIVMLAESRPEASQQFFARLKERLHEEAPHEAEYLLRSVSAIVVPDGRPFRNAEEFLAYALDEI